MAHRDHSGTPVAGVPRVEFAPEEITGVIKDAEALKAARAKRPTEERLGRLEDKHDALDGKLDKLVVDVALISGKLDVVPTLVGLLTKVVDGEVAGDQAKLTATLEINKAQSADQLKDNEVKRKFLDGLATKALAGLAAIGAIIGAYLAGRS